MLDVRRSPELQDTLLALRASRGDLRTTLLREARTTLSGEWRPALERRATGPMGRAVIVKGARVATSAQGFNLRAGTSTKALRGGLRPVAAWWAIEFGAARKRVDVATHSRRGRPYVAHRLINRQLPTRVKEGRIAFDAASELGTRLVGLWVLTIVRTYRAAAEGAHRG